MSKKHEQDNGPKIPIPGAAGMGIFAALQGLAMTPGPGIVTICKKPVAGGGYIYEIARDQQAPRFTDN